MTYYLNLVNLKNTYFLIKIFDEYIHRDGDFLVIFFFLI